MSKESIDLRDQLSIETPELVGIEFPLAGIGSRCVALLVDSFVQGFSFVVLLIVLVLIFAALPQHSQRRSRICSQPTRESGRSR